jgi:hypothetical protein
MYSLLPCCLKRKVVLSTCIKICDFCCIVCGIFGIFDMSYFTRVKLRFLFFSNEILSLTYGYIIKYMTYIFNLILV